MTAVTVGARGVDVSTWQHPDGKPIDWHEVAASGITFALVKATQGTGWVNNWLARDLDDARSNGLLVGAYHFYELGVSAEAQVDHAISTLMGQELELGFYLDWEPAEVQSWELPATYGVFLEKAMQVRNPTGTYCDLSWYTQLKTTNQPIYRLWLADYNPTEPVKCFMWQHSATGSVPGIPAPVDLDTLESTRGLNIPTAPKAAPTAATVHSVMATAKAEEPADEDPAWSMLAAHTPPEGAMTSTADEREADS